MSSEVSVESTGETVGEAKWKALRDLERLAPGIDKANVRFQIVSEGERGLLGVGYTPARVIAAADAPDAPEPVQVLEVAEHLREQPGVLPRHVLVAVDDRQEVVRGHIAVVAQRREDRREAPGDERAVGVDVTGQVGERTRMAGQGEGGERHQRERRNEQSEQAHFEKPRAGIERRTSREDHGRTVVNGSQIRGTAVTQRTDVVSGMAPAHLLQ